MPRTSPKQFLPLAPLDFQILSLLAGRELHGYGIVQACAQAFPDQPSLEIGSLYRIIGRLLDAGLIREVDAPHPEPADLRVRRYYTVTALGRAVGKAEAERLRALLAHPATLRLLGARR
ncbi:MAG TPA: PadR family transcriptional regulator [Gemmatimonadales bacterium]|jgi:DNA-binding PadR family transcriptional regulator|nr:PadR family transcriptional regulator [Gemmatimonadales bacterium]